MGKTREFEKTINYVLEAIENQSLEIGSHLPSERKIAEELGTSRNSVREGMRVLENMGVIYSRQGSGNYLNDDMGKSFARIFDTMILLNKIPEKDVIEFRKHIELCIFKMAFQNKNKKEYLNRIESILEDFEKLSKEEQVKRDYAFHYALIVMADNQLLQILMQSLSHIYGVWISEVLGVATDEERKILDRAHHHVLESLQKDRLDLGVCALQDHYACIDAISYRVSS